MRDWLDRARIDYTNHYMALYAAFNIWYRVQTGTMNDRQALNTLRGGCEPWQRALNGAVCRGITPYMELLVEYTQREPLSYATPHWRGEVSSKDDWPSLLEYWYRVRCLVMHGAEIQPTYVYLAYETLNVFMGWVAEDALY